MRRFQIYLADHQPAALKRAARKLKIKRSEFIRAALDEKIERTQA